MNVSFQGIGQVCATFLCGDVKAGQVVKVTAAGTVGPCADNDPFCGVVMMTKGGGASVQVAGFATVGFSGEAPAAGFAKLAADNSGGVKTAPGGRDYLVVDTDAVGKTITIKL